MPVTQRAPTRQYDGPEWDSVGATANRLGVHPHTIYRGLWNGTLPFDAVKVGRVWRIRMTDVERYADSSTPDGTAALLDADQTDEPDPEFISEEDTASGPTTRLPQTFARTARLRCDALPRGS